MALIMRAALQNETFRKIDTTTSYEFPATKKSAAKTITMGHKMMYPTDSRYYEGIIGGKTVYTSKAGNTFDTCLKYENDQISFDFDNPGEAPPKEAAAAEETTALKETEESERKTISNHEN